MKKPTLGELSSARLDLMNLNDGSATYFNGWISSAIDVSVVSRPLAALSVSQLHPTSMGGTTIPYKSLPTPLPNPPLGAKVGLQLGRIRRFVPGTTKTPAKIEEFTAVIGQADETAISKASSQPGRTRKALKW